MFYVDESSKKPLYLQLYDYLSALIVDGTLVAGYRLPSTRKMAEDFFISRNTVENAYSQLCADGLIESRIGSGFFVLDISNHQLDLDGMPISRLQELKEKPMGNEKKAVVEDQYPYDFFYKGLLTGTFPLDLFLANMKDALATKNKQFKFFECHGGEMPLRQELAQFLKIQRGIHCSPEQIILCPCLPYAFAEIAHLFENDEKILAMEDPGRASIRAAFINEGFEIKPVPVTRDGIDVDVLCKTDATLSFVMPSHQFPLGGSLSVNKRLQILDWLEKNDSYLVEHDFDCYLRYHERPVPSIQGISDGSRVFHVNTLEKLLYPSTHMCYVVLPPAFVDKFSDKFSPLHNNVSDLEQQVVFQLLRDGQFKVYLRRLANESMKKHDILIEALSSTMGKNAVIGGHNAGTHITLRFCDGSKASERIRQAERVGVKVYPIEKYYYDKTAFKDDTVLIGWNIINKEDLIEGVRILCKTWFNKGIQLR